MTTLMITAAQRLAEVRALVAAFPESVIAVSYAGCAPDMVRLDALVGDEALPELLSANASLSRLILKWRAAQPELATFQLMQKAIPVSDGDREVFSARLGKWLFEIKVLEQQLKTPP